jgi:phosphonate transport system ATP-binding protein
VLCVLHQPELARRFADRILGMQAGRIVFNHEPRHVRDNEVSALYVKRDASQRLAA